MGYQKVLRLNIIRSLKRTSNRSQHALSKRGREKDPGRNSKELIEKAFLRFRVGRDRGKGIEEVEEEKVDARRYILTEA